MTGWKFPPLDPIDYMSAIQALASEEARPVKDQHVVSRAILKRFGRVKGSSGHQIGRFDKKAVRELDPKGPNACGFVRNFVQYASGSAEALWHTIENRLSYSISAAESSALHNDAELETVMKHAIALHFVRSPVYRRVHERSFNDSVRTLRAELLEGRHGDLRTVFRRRYGLEPAGIEALEILIDEPFAFWQRIEEDGSLFRISLEQNFYRLRSALDNLSVQVLHTPGGKELVLSDSPAFTFINRQGGGYSVRMAVGDSHGIAMPITPNCLVAISPRPSDEMMDQEMVDNLNIVQIGIAERQIYFRPGSGLEHFVRSKLENSGDF
ncbi:hypothetical protein JOD54_000970 [Actinokineospora baliensis]|uniref:DUF4238 domain-containing protein n=1 Tax=Actinokineospora baliensis TaxID=547056 RepID=UPI00195D9E55|nr:DUF4238 domain-containing protein [Actinokineospora baliensis]MBM7770766.1 hypothetical protein [Actinokineospora baliensis]